MSERRKRVSRAVNSCHSINPEFSSSKDKKVLEDCFPEEFRLQMKGLDSLSCGQIVDMQ